MFDDIIFVDDPRSWPPHEKASHPKWIKHVHCDGARFHAPTFSLYESYRGNRAVTWCSEKRCIMNKIACEELAEIGIKPPPP